MLAAHRDLNPEEKTAYIENTARELEAGTYNPLEAFILVARRRNKDRFNRTITGSIIGTVLFTGFVSSSLSIGGAPVLLIGTGTFAACLTVAAKKRRQVTNDIANSDFGYFLTEDELEEAESLVVSITPANNQIKEAIAALAEMCAEELGPLDVEQKAAMANANTDHPVDSAENVAATNSQNNPQQATAETPSTVETDQLDYQQIIKLLDQQLSARFGELQHAQAEFHQNINTQLGERITKLERLLTPASESAAPQSRVFSPKNSPARPAEKPQTVSEPTYKNIPWGNLETRQPSAPPAAKRPAPPVSAAANLTVAPIKLPRFKGAQIDITGWTIEDFRNNVEPGTFKPEDTHNEIKKRQAMRKVWECMDKYARKSAEFYVWYVFGIKRVSGGKNEELYKSAAAWCKNVIAIRTKAESKGQQVNV